MVRRLSERRETNAVSGAEASSGLWADVGPAEPQYVVHRLRESIAQDLAALSVHLCVLQEKAKSAELASQIAELQQVAAGALHNLIDLVSGIEEAVGYPAGAAGRNHAAAERVGEQAPRTLDAAQTEVETLRRGNQRLKQLVKVLSRPAGRRLKSQSDIANRRARTRADGLSFG